MDKAIYERLFTTRAYLVIQKSEELCQACKYESITPLVLFVSMLIVEKDYLKEIFQISDLDYTRVCQKAEGKLANISRGVSNDYTFSEDSSKIITDVVNSKTHHAATLVELLRVLVSNEEISELIDFKDLDIPEQNEEVLMFDPSSGTFKNGVSSYHDDISRIDLAPFSGYIGEGFR